MSSENVQIVRDLMALGGGDRGGGDCPLRTDRIAPDIEIDMSRRVLNPAIYRGIDGLTRLYKEIGDVWEEFRGAPERFVDAGDRVVVIETIHARGRGSGVELTRRTATIWTLRDGQVTHHVKIGFDPHEALQAVGLE